MTVGCRESKRHTIVQGQTYEPAIIYLDKVKDKKWINVEVHRAIVNYKIAGGIFSRPLIIYLTTDVVDPPQITQTAILVTIERTWVPDLSIALELWKELS